MGNRRTYIRSKTPGGFLRSGDPEAVDRRLQPPLRRGAVVHTNPPTEDVRSPSEAGPQNRPTFHFRLPEPDPKGDRPLECDYLGRIFSA
jgi:hypothetical protein